MSKKDQEAKSAPPAAAPEPKQEVAVQPTQGTALEAFDFDYGGDAGAGMEDVKSGEFKIPFLRLLQPLSPACSPGTQIPGAVPGLFLNSGTQEVMDPGQNGLTFVPVYRDHAFVEYIPRDAGGGFVGIYKPEDPLILSLVDKQGRFGKLAHSHEGRPTEIIEAYSLYGILFREDGSTSPVVISFSSTQVKKYQNLMMRLLNIEYTHPTTGAIIKPPIWAHRWKLGVQAEQNKKGKFYGWTLRLEQEPPIKSRISPKDPLYARAKELHESLKSGAIVADHEGDQKVRGGEGDGEIPF